MALWSTLLVGGIALIAFLVFSGGDGDSERGIRSSRFAPIHTFETADYHSLALSPKPEGVVLFGHHNGVQVSENAGRNWRTVLNEEGRDAMNLVFDPFSPDTVYMAGHNVYMRSDDGGKTWTDVRSNLPSLDLHTFAASPVKERRLYAIPAGQGLYVSDDGGQQWQLVFEDAPPGSNSVVELPDGTLLLGATDQGILRSEDGGKTWSQSRAGIDIGAIYVIRADPKGERVYSGTNDGVYVSTDGGRMWTKTALDDTWVVAIGVSPSDPKTVFAVNRNGELYRSVDGGTTWG